MKKLITGVSALFFLCLQAHAAEDELEARARAIHDAVMTLDTHVDIPLNFATSGHMPENASTAQVNLEAMRSGGLDSAFFIVYMGQTERTPENYLKAKADALTKFAAIHRMVELYPDEIGLAVTAEEARALHDEGKLVSLIGIENGYAIGKDLSLLEEYAAMGARYMTLVHNGDNDIGDSAQPNANLGDNMDDDGLTEFGYEVVAELNRLGILVDVSHVSRQTMLDATRASTVPVIASHSSVKALTDHPRNMDDEQLRVLADNGGVVQIVAFESYVMDTPPEKAAAQAELREEMGIFSGADFQALDEAGVQAYQAGMAAINEQWPGASVSDLVDHIDYAVDLIGLEHVGIASDFDGGGGISGWDNAADTFNVTLELVRRGYSEEDIGMLWSGNTLRILEQAEQLAE